MYIGTIFQTSSVSKPVCSVFKIRHWIMFLEIGEVNFAKRMPLLHSFFSPKSSSTHSQTIHNQLQSSVGMPRKEKHNVHVHRTIGLQFKLLKSHPLSKIIANNLPAFHFASDSIFCFSAAMKGESHRFLIHIHNMNSFQSFIS